MSEETRCADLAARDAAEGGGITMSLNAIGCVSPQHSHVKAPASAIPDEPQKPIPFARAAL